MALFAEYVMTPDVFDLDCYSNADLCGERLQQLKDAFLAEGIVRDLRNGEWRAVFSEDSRLWHRRAKEILRKLKSSGRLVESNPELDSTPQTDYEWCEEALASHNTLPLNGILVNDAVARAYRRNPLVSSVNKLSGANWWSPLDGSQRLNRKITEYKIALAAILRHANSIMFIDPNIDPDSRNYADFAQLLQAAGNRSPQPRIEIHRKCLRGSGRMASLWDQTDMEATFRRQLAPALSTAGLEVEMFVWDDLHDRYLISDLVGISVPYGFDTSTSPVRTTWTRLGRSDRDDIQREFDPASRDHTLQFRFTIP